MGFIRAAQYGEAVRVLRRDVHIQFMAMGLREIPREQLAHENGTPRHEFMAAASEEYRKRGGLYDGPECLGTIAEALVSLLDFPATGEEVFYGMEDRILGIVRDHLVQMGGDDPWKNLTEAQRGSLDLVNAELRRRGVPS